MKSRKQTTPLSHPPSSHLIPSILYIKSTTTSSLSNLAQNFTMGFLPNRNQESNPAQEAGTISPSDRITDKSSDRTLTPGHENQNHLQSTGVDIKRATKARKNAIYITSFLYLISFIFLVLVRPLPLLSLTVEECPDSISSGNISSSPQSFFTSMLSITNLSNPDHNRQHTRPTRPPQHLVLPP